MLKLLIRAVLWIKARPSSRSIQVGATFSYAKYPEKCFTQICTDLYGDRGGSRIFSRRGCTHLLLYFSTNKPYSFFFGRIPVVLENRRLSRGWGGGAHPLHPPPRSAPGRRHAGVHSNALKPAETWVITRWVLLRTENVNSSLHESNLQGPLTFS